MQLDVLAIGSHPDDVELCCSGTLAKMVRLGYKAGIVDITRGELGTRGTTAIRTREANEAARILGCVRENAGLPDGGIEVNQKNIRKLIQIYRKYRPTILLIPHWLERHPDHVHTHHLCREAWFYSGLRRIRTSINGKPQDPWRPRNYLHYMQWYEFEPSVVVDISDVHQKRMASIKAHRSQFHDPSSRDPQTILSQEHFLRFVEARARNYGMKIGVEYGEPFFSIENIGVRSLSDLQLFHG